VKRWGDRGKWRATAAIACVLMLALALPVGAAASGGAQASIVGGRPASIAEFPSLAFIEAHEGKHGFACSGTVVAPRVVLTAAHCVEEIETGTITPAANYAVATGVTDPSEAGIGNVFHIAETHVFPGFDPGILHGDAAILILSTPTSAPPMPMAGAGDAPLYTGGATVQLTGWGLTSAKAEEEPGGLRTTPMLVQTPTSCKQKTRSFYRSYSQTAQVCLLAATRASGGCFGDSGGPAIGQRADGSPVEIGITSTGGPNCSTRLPNVLTRVDYVSTWVTEWIAAVETGAPPPAGATTLPAMTKEGAEQFAVLTLLGSFGKRFAGAREVAGNCRKASHSRFQCQIAWITGRDVYAAKVSPFYILRQGAVAWDSHFKAEWALLKCIRKSHHCAIHTKRG
jgi:secreted trypsin-like serine protease